MHGQAAEVTLEWDPNNPGPDGYKLYQRIQGQPYDYTVFRQVLHPQTRITIEIAPGVPYCWVVRAYIGDNQSGDSNEACYTAPLIVEGIRLSEEEE